VKVAGRFSSKKKCPTQAKKYPIINGVRRLFHDTREYRAVREYASAMEENSAVPFSWERKS